MAEIRTRFAPSPTGHLHLGGARTALFNRLFAKRHGGSFVLRIEDTDRERSKDEHAEAILDGLAWLGIDWDGQPVFQSRRSELYRKRTAELFEAGACYYCFCPPEMLDEKRKAAQKAGRKPVYDRTCRELGRTPGQGETAVVRLRAPTEGQTLVEDLVRGRVEFDNAELDDLVLVRSDGSPTFHLVVVADDIDMGISHVLRGEDHLTNTPKQLHIFSALGAEPPKYGHLPLIVGSDRARLSKRHGATSVSAYREQGFLPVAVANYLVRLGWSHGDQELFGQTELESLFDIEGVGKAAAAFDMEKFTWVNFQHMKATGDGELATAVGPFLAARNEPTVDQAYLESVVGLLKDRAKTLDELAEFSHFFVNDDIAYSRKAAAKFLGPGQLELLDELAGVLGSIGAWTADAIEAAFTGLLEAKELKLGKLAQPVRVALTGDTVSPGIFELCQVLGRDRTLARLAAVVEAGRAGTLTLAD